MASRTKKRCRAIDFSSSGHEGKVEEADELKFTQRHFDYLEQVKQAEIARLRTEYEQFIMKKDQEMNQYKHQMAHLQERQFQHEKEMERLLSENKLLKRAVTIQNQQKEECQQENTMLKNLTTQAAEHIKRLEQTNYALRVHLQTSNSTNVGGTTQAPDVF